MKNTKESIERLKKFSRLYECASLAYSENLNAFSKNLDQYRGSSEIDGGIERATLVRNVTYELIESMMSPDVPQAKVETESYTEGSEALASSIERLLLTTRERLPFDEINDANERCTYLFGGSLMLVEWARENGAGEVRVRHIPPRDFVPEPGIGTIEDMSYCFLKFVTTKGELISRYGISEGDIPLTEQGFTWGGTTVFDDTVTVIICFYKNKDGSVGRLVFSGDLVLSDEVDYYGSLLDGEDENEEYENISLQNSDGKRKTIAVKKYKPKEFPIVLRKNISSEGNLLGVSDAETLRPIQQAINKIESRIMQKLLRAGVTPIMPEDATVSLSNAIFGQVVKIRSGESASQYGTVDTTPDISQDIKEADRLYDHAKRLIGISDAYQGIDQNRQESGYAKELRINQSASRLESKRRMKNIAYERLYKLIFQHYLTFSDSEKKLSYKDGFGIVRDQKFDKRDFITEGEQGEFYYNDSFVFTTDKDLFAEYQREALWERNLANLDSGTLGNKDDPRTLLRYWQFQQRAHYPGAKDNVDYFKAMIENERSDKNGA